MRKLPRFTVRAAGPAVSALALPLLGGVAPACQGTPPAAPVAAPAAAFAGVAYDPAAPLTATEKPLFDPGSPPPQALTYAVRFAGAAGEPVPGVLVVPAGGKTGERRPAVLLLHGLGGKKEDFFIAQAVLARRGYASLAIDAAGHGQRPGVGGKKVSDLSLGEMRQLVARTVVDLRRATDYLAARADVDAGRIGFLGVSLGGIIGADFVGTEPRVKGAVLWAAGGDWGKLITGSGHDFAKAYRTRGATDAAKIEAAMADVDPVNYVGKAAPRPLLFLNGTADPIVPRVCTDALFAAAAQPKRIEFLPGGHVPDPAAMLTKSLDWLDANVRK
jgi:dienelactone hydrolase